MIQSVAYTSVLVTAHCLSFPALRGNLWWMTLFPFYRFVEGKATESLPSEWLAGPGRAEFGLMNHYSYSSLTIEITLFVHVSLVSVVSKLGD